MAFKWLASVAFRVRCTTQTHRDGNKPAWVENPVENRDSPEIEEWMFQVRGCLPYGGFSFLKMSLFGDSFYSATARNSETTAR